MPFYEQILRDVAQRNWPATDEVTSQTRDVYASGIDLVDGYRGHPDILVQALDRFQETGCRPYAYAGIAYTLIAASYISGRNYEEKGLDAATSWLRKAQEIIPDQPEINFVQMFIDMPREDYDAVLAQINDLELVTDEHFHVQLAKLSYRCHAQSLRLAEAQYQKLLKMARTKNQQLLAHGRMVKHYMWAMTAFKAIADHTGESATKEISEYGRKAEIVHHQMAPLAQDDPWYWHNRSVACVMTGSYWKAAKYNKRALALMSFGNALNMKQHLKQKLRFLYALA